MEKKKGDIIRFKQFDKEVRDRVEGFLPNGDYTVELLDDAPPFFLREPSFQYVKRISSLEVFESEYKIFSPAKVSAFVGAFLFHFYGTNNL